MIKMMSNHQSSMRLEDQVAIITGVSHAGQVGFALASAMAREGSMLAISSRTRERVNARAEELRAEGAQVIAVPADLTTEEGATILVQETLKSYGRIDILVNLAGGLTKYGPSDELTLADWDFELNNNLRSAFLCSRTVWPIMKKQNKGKLLNFSRAGGIQSAGPNMLAYNCAKAGVDALTRTLAKEGKNVGIYVNAIGPGLIVTQSNIESMKPSPEDVRKKWVSIEQIVEAAIFLVSTASDGITGAILPVQGKGI
jgi:NAD(P)-dependent dehydrogenase (short-subunit alcohol dehydrogenase family)